jgi:hypothetical protein
MQEWTKAELEFMDLGDGRLIKRLNLLLDSFTENPSSSIPGACESSAKTKAAYRFFDNERLESAKIREGFFKKTVVRAKEYKEVLAISDLTGFVYTSHKSLTGKGVLRNFKASGLIAHSCFIVSSDEEPLGLTYQKFWGRDPKEYGKRKFREKRDITEKESYFWLESFTETQKYLFNHPHVIFIGDRGSDLLALFNQPRQQNFDLLIRSCHNRRIKDESDKKLFEHLKKSKLLGYVKTEIINSKTKKTRIAKLAVRSTEVTLAANDLNKKNKLKDSCINAIIAEEVGNIGPEDERVNWKLLTSLPVATLKESAKCIDYYKKRWLIERYHFVLKSGCKLEKLQLRDAQRIDKALATYSIVAWRLMYLTYLARIKPNSPCSIVLGEDEWKALFCYTDKKNIPPKKPPNIKEAVMRIAKIGGFQGRKGDGMPGMKTVWLGLMALSHIVESFKLWCKK